MPWLTQQAVSHLERGMLSRAVVAQIVADAVAMQQNQEEAASALADAQAAAAEAYAAKVGRLLAGTMLVASYSCFAPLSGSPICNGCYTTPVRHEACR